uniref:VWFC domain-containing protein n=1 Tax=Timema cristinae TaxID=61476 RepID=A0A7R9D8L2_TIMCR|nr:unnamed protein product [Timema cristinae]
MGSVQCRLPAECYPTLHTHYEEIGCEPVFGDGPCPLKYDCSLFMARNSSRCYLNGNEYEIGASIGNIYPMCSAACFCDGRSESGAVITCANIECAEFFRPPAPNCIPQYFLDDCCSNSTFCKNKTDDVTEVTCNVGNETFIEGQKFYPSDDDCKSCVCQQGYDGTTNGPWCKKINCGFELRSANKFRQGCAPVYYGTDRCCSIGFKCPEDESLEVVPAVVDGNASTRTGGIHWTDASLIYSSTGSSVRSVDRVGLPSQVVSFAGEIFAENWASPTWGDKCEFGSLRLNVNDQLSPSSNKCVECTCKTPPFVTCIQKTDC